MPHQPHRPNAKTLKFRLEFSDQLTMEVGPLSHMLCVSNVHGLNFYSSQPTVARELDENQHSQVATTHLFFLLPLSTTYVGR